MISAYPAFPFSDYTPGEHSTSAVFQISEDGVVPSSEPEVFFEPDFDGTVAVSCSSQPSLVEIPPSECTRILQLFVYGD